MKIVRRIFAVLLIAASTAAALAPAGLPRDVTTRLGEAFRQVMASPDIRNRMVAQGADPAFLGSEDFARFLAAEMPRWAEAVKKSGARLD